MTWRHFCRRDTARLTIPLHPYTGVKPPSFNERFVVQKQRRPASLSRRFCATGLSEHQLHFRHVLHTGQWWRCAVWSSCCLKCSRHWSSNSAAAVRRLCFGRGKKKKNMKGNHLKSTEVAINDDSVLMHILEQCCTELYRNYIFHPSKPCFGGVRTVNMPLRDPLCQYLIWEPLLQ